MEHILLFVAAVIGSGLIAKAFPRIMIRIFERYPRLFKPDNLHSGLSGDAFKRFTAMLDKPPASNPKLRRLLHARAPWDK